MPCNNPGSADGEFGEQTESPVKLYQCARGLVSDGVAGRATLRLNNEDIRNGVMAQSTIVD